MLPRVVATAYVVPLREGGSLPAVVESEGGRLWVAKFRGAGQGPKALAAEVIGGELARRLGLATPELCVLEIDPAIGRNEGDPEIRELLMRSAGDNLGAVFLDAALPFDPAAQPAVDGLLASRIVVLDAFLQNVDRTAKNPNLLWCGDALWLIDFGAALYWHHAWDGSTAGADAPFAMIRQHVLLPWADRLEEAGQWLVAGADDATLAAVLDAVPDAWLEVPEGRDPPARRAAYVGYLSARRAAAARFLEEALRARA